MFHCPRQVAVIRRLMKTIRALLCYTVMCGGARAAAEKGSQPKMTAMPTRVYTVKPDASRAGRVAYVLSLSEEAMLRIVPKQSGIFFTDCPNCDGGSTDRGNWEWVPADPGALTCKDCGAQYPNHPTYTDNAYLSVPAPNGEHRYPYYEDAAGYRFYFRAAADHIAGLHMADRCRDLAEEYDLTGNELYARRAALILLRFAEVYPGWAMKYDYPDRQKRFSPWTGPRIAGPPEHRTSIWNAWSYTGISREMLIAYDCIRTWPGLDQLAQSKARTMIEQDLLANMVEFCNGAEMDILSNMNPHLWQSTLEAAMLLNRGDWMQKTLGQMNEFLRVGFLHDAYWMETSPSYCRQVWGGMHTIAKSLAQYRPPETLAAETRRALERALLELRAGVSSLNRAYSAAFMPCGCDPIINDTWAHGRLTHAKRVRSSTESVLLPGLGLAVLGAGEGDNQIYAWLNFTSGVHHKHHDALSVGLFADNRERLRDIGYTHTAWRSWSASVMSHNTVVVDGSNGQFDVDHAGHRLRSFLTDQRGFHLAEADCAAGTYPEKTQRYRRTLVLVGRDSRDAYLVDVFQVQGGRQHDYLLHGNADRDSTADIPGIHFQPYAGTLLEPGAIFSYPGGEGDSKQIDHSYGFVHDLRHAKAPTLVQWTLRPVDEPSLGVASFLACPNGATLFTGEAPRIRQAERHDDQLPEFNAPFLCARVNGPSPLQTVFAAVHEPFNDEPRTRTVRRLPIPGGVVLEITRDTSCVDYFAMQFDGLRKQTFDTSLGPIHLDGRYGLIRFGPDAADGATAGPTVIEATLAGGTELRWRDFRLQGQHDLTGAVVAAGVENGGEARGWIELDQPLPGPPYQSSLVLQFADGRTRGYTILDSRRSANGTRVATREMPGFTMDGRETRWISFPQKQIPAGAITWSLPVLASWRASDSDVAPRGVRKLVPGLGRRIPIGGQGVSR